MHTVVFGWFGGSAVWFLPLLWRLVRTVLPGGAGLRGPGTIRLWLGFVCVLAASCTLEASLIGVAGINGFGHALAAGLGHLLGHIGTPLAALALLLISLPWLIDFRWRDFAAWADSAFGLGLSRGLARRDEDARRHRSIDDGAPSHLSPSTNTMAPKVNGRYARPTVWRPPASGRAAASGVSGTGDVAGVVGGVGGVAAARDASARGARGASSWRSGAAATRNPSAQAEPVLRTGALNPSRQASMQPKTADKTPFMPTEPVAPAGWLREPAPRAAAPLGRPSPAHEPAMTTRDAASQPGRRAAGEQRPAGASMAGAGLTAAGTLASSSASMAAPVTAAAAAARTVHGSTAARAASSALASSTGSMTRAAQSASRPTSILGSPTGASAPAGRAPAAPHQPLQRTPVSSGGNPIAGVRRNTPAYTRPMATNSTVAPSASVQETLRSIAENAARWTDLAGVSLARNRGVEDAMMMGTPVDAGRPLGADVTAPLDEALEKAREDFVSARLPVETAAVEQSAVQAGIQDAPVEISTEPVVQWPIEPPFIHLPSPVTAEASASASDVETTVMPVAVAPAVAAAPEVVAPASIFSVPAASVENSLPPQTALPSASAFATPAPTAAAPTHAPQASAPTPFQIFAAQLQAKDAPSFEDESTGSAALLDGRSPSVDEAAPTNVATPIQTADTALPGDSHVADSVTLHAPTPSAEAVVDDEPLAPWDIEAASDTSLHVTASSNSSPVESVDVPDEAAWSSHDTTTHGAVTSEPVMPLAADMSLPPALLDFTAMVGTSDEADAFAAAESPRELESLAAHIADMNADADASAETTAAQVSNVVRFPRLAVQPSTPAPVVVPDEPVRFVEPVNVKPVGIPTSVEMPAAQAIPEAAVAPLTPVARTASVSPSDAMAPAGSVTPTLPVTASAPVSEATSVSPVTSETAVLPTEAASLAVPVVPENVAGPAAPVVVNGPAADVVTAAPVTHEAAVIPVAPVSTPVSTAPVAPVATPVPATPVTPLDTAVPTAPVAFVAPATSITSAAAAVPAASAIPVATAVPAAPAIPEAAAVPATSPTPVATTVAAVPATPVATAVSAAPVTHDAAVVPVAPAVPVTTTIPATSLAPVTTAIPALAATSATTAAPTASAIPLAPIETAAPTVLGVPTALATPTVPAAFPTSAPNVTVASPTTPATPVAAETASTHPAPGYAEPASALAPTLTSAPTPEPPAEPQPEQLEQSGQPAPPRPPLRGHAPANGFEFRAPAASMIELPTLDLLAPADTDIESVSEEKLVETGQLIEQRLQEFKVPVTVVGASAGPVITRFEVEPALGVRGSQIVGLMKDLSRGLGLTSIRVVETIPGKTCMGLELPNAKRQTIRLSEILEASVYQNSHSQLTLAMGKDITGHPVVADLAKAPHMLVAGTTGSGKSVAINAMICSLLFKATPEEVRLIMIDPKMLELSVYEGIPHLLAPVVTDMKLAANALNWCVGEMEKRYRLMSAVGVRNLAGFNQKIRDTEAKGKKLGNPFSLTPDAPEPLAPLPLIVVVIDELADLMMVAGKKIEELIARLAQKARAAGIHLILATQRPSVDVITGLIKANIPTRVAFQVSSKIDSRTILDQMGAESLLGQGDMLFLPPGTGYPQRVHGAFVADEEVHAIVEYLKQFGEPQYEEGILDGPATDGGAAQDLFGESPDAEADPLYDEAVAFVVRTRRASISSVQRQLRIGYNRAARLVEQMETAGLVSAMSINGSREVLAPGPAE